VFFNHLNRDINQSHILERTLIIRKDDENKKSKPIHGFNAVGGLGDCNTKSTHDLGANKINTQGNKIASNFPVRYVKFVISLTAVFVSFMRLIF
jgi:hypothetical protein